MFNPKICRKENMQNQADYQRKMTILSLTFKDRMRIAWQLTKPRLLPYLLFFLVLGVVSAVAFGIPAILTGIFPLFLVLFAVPLVALTFVSIGFYSSVLRYMDGLEPVFQISTILEPFKRWQSLLPAILIFGVVYIVLEFIVALLTLIPILGSIISLASMIFFSIIIACYFFYFAEHKQATLNELLSNPIKMIMPNLSRWMAAFGASVLAYLPLILLVIVGLLLALLEPYFLDELYYYDSAYYNDYYGESSASQVIGIIVMIVMFIAGLLLGCVAYIFSMFLYAIAYKQSQIAMEMQLNSQPQNVYTPPPPFNNG